ncbi:ribosome recycling factor [Candidatus Wolfebacteria bacterium]|nr:ribosome recycling factor [Candidatus Wolfebacteria bacterium]
MYDFKTLKTKIAETEEWLKKELMTIQTGRATPAILDGVLVDSYGTKVHVNQVANITTEDARTLRIVPWDKDSIRAIETAIRDADMGLGVSVDDQGVQVGFPELTTETREKFVKLVRDKVEDAKIALRNVRDEVWSDIQRKEKAGDIGEDDKFRFKDKMEKIVKEGNETLGGLAERKEKEILG